LSASFRCGFFPRYEPKSSKGTVPVPCKSHSLTPGALEALERNEQHAHTLLGRHQSADWGDLAAADRAENDRAAIQSTRILSAYRLTDETRIWIITEADRSSTCILLPDEY
jgi:hypothetical protein